MRKLASWNCATTSSESDTYNITCKTDTTPITVRKLVLGKVIQDATSETMLNDDSFVISWAELLRRRHGPRCTKLRVPSIGVKLAPSGKVEVRSQSLLTVPPPSDIVKYCAQCGDILGGNGEEYYCNKCARVMCTTCLNFNTCPADRGQHLCTLIREVDSVNRGRAEDQVPGKTLEDPAV